MRALSKPAGNASQRTPLVLVRPAGRSTTWSRLDQGVECQINLTVLRRPLNPTHLAWFPFKRFSRDWVARLEQRFPELLPSRSPRCFVALDAEGPLAAVVAHPTNRRGSCWTLQRPLQIRRAAHHSARTVQRTLLQAALQLGDHQICSWVIRCPAADADAVALHRELGFQPLRPFQIWLPEQTTSSPMPPTGSGSRSTAACPMLWPIEQGEPAICGRSRIGTGWTCWIAASRAVVC